LKEVRFERVRLFQTSVLNREEHKPEVLKTLKTLKFCHTTSLRLKFWVQTHYVGAIEKEHLFLSIQDIRQNKNVIEYIKLAMMNENIKW
jgi:hypothetical protein